MVKSEKEAEAIGFGIFGGALVFAIAHFDGGKDGFVGHSTDIYKIIACRIKIY